MTSSARSHRAIFQSQVDEGLRRAHIERSRAFYSLFDVFSKRRAGTKR